MSNFIYITPREETFRIDFSLDDSSFGRYFECIKPAKAAPNQVDNLLSFIDIVEDDESTSEELQQAANLVKQAQNQNNFETEFEYYKFISKEEEKAVLEYAKKTLTEIEAFLKEKNLTDFSKLCETTTQFKYFKLRVFNEFKRSNFSMLLENLEANCIDVYLKNLFETHGMFALILVDFNIFQSISSPQEEDKSRGKMPISIRQHLERLCFEL